MNASEFVQRTAGGKFFSVTFIKRTTGQVRQMLCRCGVMKHLKGGELSYDPAGKGLLPVYDVKAEGYRQVPLDGITEMKLDGESYRWEPGTVEFVRVVP